MKLIWLVCMGLCLGCGTLDPELGPAGAEQPTPHQGTCDLTDSDPDSPVDFALLQDVILQPECSCHVEEGGIGRTEGGLDLEDYDAVLLGGRNSPGNAVIPGDPCESVLVQKLSNTPPFGARMPFRTFQLPPESRQLIIDWIAEGAPR
jgi:hypothetical protein